MREYRTPEETDAVKARAAEAKKPSLDQGLYAWGIHPLAPDPGGWYAKATSVKPLELVPDADVLAPKPPFLDTIRETLARQAAAKAMQCYTMNVQLDPSFKAWIDRKEPRYSTMAPETDTVKAAKSLSPTRPWGDPYDPMTWYNRYGTVASFGTDGKAAIRDVVAKCSPPLTMAHAYHDSEQYAKAVFRAVQETGRQERRKAEDQLIAQDREARRCNLWYVVPREDGRLLASWDMPSEGRYLCCAVTDCSATNHVTARKAERSEKGTSVVHRHIASWRGITEAEAMDWLKAQPSRDE